ncbi:MAG: prenyltransferase/squalene oxidase repeat-containing protein, partial [Planctomycetota bacterium]
MPEARRRPPTAARKRIVVTALAVLSGAGFGLPDAAAQELTSENVKRSIERGVAALSKLQNDNGSWNSPNVSHTSGATALCVLALINSGESVDSPAVAAGLKYLRDRRPGQIMGDGTYDVSLALMAFAAAKDGRRDGARMLALTRALEAGRVKVGPHRGGWTYGLGENNRGADRSNSQYAVLGLRDAAYAGIPVQRQTWEDVRNYWVGGNAQNRDGGYTYGLAGGGARGSMTVAGIATVSILKSVLKEDNLKPDGTPNCCAVNAEEERLDEAVERASEWLTRRFSVTRNPQYSGHTLYYLYGLERAGRLAGKRFFGPHDWYREGAEFLVVRNNQNPRTGGWQGNGFGENNETIGTAFALLFLSKGLSPVLINKLKYNDRGTDQWDAHPADARNLTYHISGLPKWPKLVTWQVLDLEKAVAAGDLAGALQGPVTLMTGKNAPSLTGREIAFLRD